MEPLPTVLWLIRHGETAWNAARRFQGQLDVPLNQQGSTQARILAARLEAEHRARPFAAVYTSDLARAVETAQATADTTGLPLSVRVGLRERHFGVLAGLTPEEMESKHPEVFSQWRARSPDAELPGGESLRAFNARIMHELSVIARAHPSQPVVIICHGGVLDCAYRAARGLPLESKREHSLHNASINLVSMSQAGELTLGPWGDIAHLEAAGTKDQPLHSGDWKETPG